MAKILIIEAFMGVRTNSSWTQSLKVEHFSLDIMRGGLVANIQTFTFHRSRSIGI